uniref:Uncharacterized protein n=1 Tax=Hucho hucho TaxID=62062 RepID=A0A4W5PEC0_9TELE
RQGGRLERCTGNPLCSSCLSVCVCVCVCVFINFFQGGKGDLGLPGLPGPAGLVGQNGDRGAVGLTGAQGEQGEAGSEGTAGDRGDFGEEGEPGEKGSVSPVYSIGYCYSSLLTWTRSIMSSTHNVIACSSQNHGGLIMIRCHNFIQLSNARGHVQVSIIISHYRITLQCLRHAKRKPCTL